jgi:hypothetical protein
MNSPSRSQPMTGSLSTEVDLVLWVQLEPKEAADHITSLKARIQELEGTLGRFVESYNYIHAYWSAVELGYALDEARSLLQPKDGAK